MKFEWMRVKRNEVQSFKIRGLSAWLKFLAPRTPSNHLDVYPRDTSAVHCLEFSLTPDFSVFERVHTAKGSGNLNSTYSGILIVSGNR